MQIGETRRGAARYLQKPLADQTERLTYQPRRVVEQHASGELLVDLELKSSNRPVQITRRKLTHLAGRPGPSARPITVKLAASVSAGRSAKRFTLA